jgi:hypothetical protein
VSVSITSPAGPIVVSPTRFSEVGIHYLKVILSDFTIDSSGCTYDNWTINVTNTAPYFNEAVLPNISFKMNETKEYVVSDFTDNEGHTAILSFK